jgi:hypothetical protein
MRTRRLALPVNEFALLLLDVPDLEMNSGERINCAMILQRYRIYICQTKFLTAIGAIDVYFSCLIPLGLHVDVFLQVCKCPMPGMSVISLMFVSA